MSQQNSSYDLSLHKVIRDNSTSPVPPIEPWVRPSDWPNIENIVDNRTSDILVGIALISNNFGTTSLSGNPNLMRIRAVSSLGTNYAVDWGDGTIDYYASNVTAEHYYDYMNVNLTPSDDGIHKYAVIQVYPVDGLNNPHTTTWMSLDLTINGIYPSPYYPGTLWVDMDMYLRGSLLNNISEDKTYIRLENVRIRNIANSSCSFLFGTKAYSLKCAEINSLPNATNLSNMFTYCYNLVWIKALDCSVATNMTSIFNSCQSLKKVPSISAPNLTTATQMFRECSSIEEIPDLNIPFATNKSGMFSYCHSLKNAPNLGGGTTSNATSMFTDCYSLKSVPSMTFSNGALVAFMFYGCISIENIPEIIVNNSNIDYMFYNCYNLKVSPLTTNHTINIPASMANLFNGCRSLQVIPNHVFVGATSINCENMFQYCYSLTEVSATLPRSGYIILDNSRLSSVAVDEIFTNLPSVTGLNIINVAATIGVGTCNPTLATAKGWTVEV